MSDTSTTDTTEQFADTATTESKTPSNSDGRDIRTLLNRLALAGLVLIAIVAGLRFYFAFSSIIDQWIVREYRSLFHAAFNLALVLLSGYGISVQVGRLR